MEWLTDPQAWLALLTLTALEIVLGIDNIIFISILTGKLPEHQRARAQKLGLSLAMLTRLLLLFSLTWVMKLTAPFFFILGHGVSGRDLILIVGGLFLLAKSTMEIHDKLEGEEHHADGSKGAVSFNGILIQIMFLDIIFSLDSVITAVGMARQLGVMVMAVVISVGVMSVFCRCGQSVCGAASHGQGAGTVVSADDRGGPDRRWSLLPYPQGLYLLCHGLLGVCGDDQHQGAQQHRETG